MAVLGISPFLINGVVGSAIADSPTAYWGFEILVWVVMPALAVGYAHRSLGLSLSDLGISTAIRGRQRPFLLAAICVASGPIIHHAYESFLAFSSALVATRGFFEHQAAIPADGHWRIAVVVWFAVSAGIVEEIFHRGLLFKIAGFTASPLAVFMLISPVTFSLVHWENGPANLLAAWLVGVMLAAAYFVLRNLLPLIVGHTYSGLVWFY